MVTKLSQCVTSGPMDISSALATRVEVVDGNTRRIRIMQVPRAGGDVETVDLTRDQVFRLVSILTRYLAENEGR